MGELRSLPAALDTAWLRDQILWTRHDFIRTEQFSAAERAALVADWIADLPGENDLRGWYVDETRSAYVFAERLPWDTAFFGYPIARLNAVIATEIVSDPLGVDWTPAIKAWVQQAKQRGIRYVFAPVFPEQLALIRALNGAGFTLIETRALYHRTLTDFTTPERYPVRAALPTDVPSLQRTAVEAVNAFDRFHADPFIDRADADRLLAEWVTASIERGFADLTLVPDVEQPQAFNTIRYQRERWETWGCKLTQTVLTAVSPNARGWHRKLIAETTHHLRELGADHTILPTQITNRAVIHNLEQLGYRFGRAEHIFRIIL